MNTEDKEFEVLSNSDTLSNGMDEEQFNDIDEECTKEDQFKKMYKDTSFFHELYKDNRNLLNLISEKENEISKLKERNFMLVNSNLFWLCCSIGSMLTTIISISNIR